ncbi:MAG: hypothetical protein ACYC1D_06065 [Acidimicrobiales bacterium]
MAVIDVGVAAERDLAPPANPHRAHPTTARRPAWRWAAVAVPALVVLLGGWAHRWAAEDAYIDFRIIHNLWAGYGPVFNPGERVEVFSDPLWLFCLAAVARVFRFVSLAWWAVILGLAGTAGGFVLGGRAAQRLAAWRGWRPAVPVGLLIAATVDGVWDFATSGLETGMIFAWEGLAWWLLVRCLTTRRGFVVTAFVSGLGPLIRPDLAVFSLVDLVVLGAIIARTSDGRNRRRRWIPPAVAATGLPMAYEIWRMAYFALAVPNTALAKSAGASWWSQGYTYFRDFYTADYLWLAAAVLVALVAWRLAQLARRRDWLLLAVLGAPLAGGILDCLFVVRVGGDFMHARMLLPSFFALAMLAWVPLPERRSWATPGLVALVGFAAVCGADFRYLNQGTIQANGIVDERLFWVSQSANLNPITLQDYRHAIGVRLGRKVAAQAANVAPGTYLVDLPGAAPVVVPAPLAGGGPERVVYPYNNIGLFGVAAGPQVYIFDDLSLATPIGSHVVVPVRSRPGEKKIGLSWMSARFVPVTTALPGSGGTPGHVRAARRALGCKALNTYLGQINGPLTGAGALADIEDSLGNTTMAFSVNPSIAAGELCRQTR